MSENLTPPASPIEPDPNAPLDPVEPTVVEAVEETEVPAVEPTTEPAPAAVSDLLTIAEDDDPVAVVPEMEVADPAVAPPAAVPGLDLSDPQQVAQATYGQTPQAYRQPPFEQPAAQTQPAPPPPPYAPQNYSMPAALVPTGTMPLAEELSWAAGAHWSALATSVVGVGFLGPLLVYLIKGNESPRVRAAAVESLNFEITFIIAMLVSIVAIIVVVGLITIWLIPLAWLVLRIVAAVAASRGEDYRYPLTLRLVR